MASETEGPGIVWVKVLQQGDKTGFAVMVDGGFEGNAPDKLTAAVLAGVSFGKAEAGAVFAAKNAEVRCLQEEVKRLRSESGQWASIAEQMEAEGDETAAAIEDDMTAELTGALERIENLESLLRMWLNAGEDDECFNNPFGKCSETGYPPTPEEWCAPCLTRSLLKGQDR